jgi:hypothetical protein
MDKNVLYQDKHLLLYATIENTYHCLAEIGHLSFRKKIQLNNMEKWNMSEKISI